MDFRRRAIDFAILNCLVLNAITLIDSMFITPGPNKGNGHIIDELMLLGYDPRTIYDNLKINLFLAGARVVNLGTTTKLC